MSTSKIANSKKCPRGNNETLGQPPAISKKPWQTRLFCFTDWNTESEPRWNPDDCQYLGYEHEICPETGRPHWQEFFYLKAKKTIKGALPMVRQFHPELDDNEFIHIHISQCGGTFEQNVNYCSKDGNFKEFGEKPNQGQRLDLIVMRVQIEQGVRVDDICMDTPHLFHQYGRTLNKLEDIIMRKQFRTEMTKGIWYWGKTGTGKSHKAFKGFDPLTHYNYPYDNGWWDGYTQQDTVIINDFRGNIPYSELLQMVDKWPYSVRRRNREPIPFTSKTIIVTSSMIPEEVYSNIHRDDNIEQLLRRFDIIEIKEREKVDIKDILKIKR